LQRIEGSILILSDFNIPNHSCVLSIETFNADGKPDADSVPCLLAGLSGPLPSPSFTDAAGAAAAAAPAPAPVRRFTPPVDMPALVARVKALTPCPRVLVAEDNRINQRVLKAVASRTGVLVDIADNGADALEKINAATPPYCGVLMDISMPVMNGGDATRHLREAERASNLPRLPVVALTVSYNAQDQYAGLFDAALFMPITTGDVALVISRFLFPDG
jgi:CheY-like chemotaxis protein